MDDRKFADELFSHPTDDTALVYADWLDEQGEADRARLIRGQVAGEGQLQPLADRCVAALPVSDSLRGKVEFFWERGLLEAWVKDRAVLEESDLRELARLPYLKTLGRFEQLSPGCLERLSTCPNIQRLSHGYTTLRVERMSAVARLRQVVALHLASEKVRDAHLEPLLAMRWLRHLDLANASVTNPWVAREFVSFAELETLSIRETRVGDGGVKSISALRRLRHLDLSATRVTDKGVAHL